MAELTPELIAKTQKILGKYVKKPALTDKLLSKPPFRFLHDIMKVIIKDTGFLKGLFTPDELNSDNVKDKAAKVAFLEKLINAVKSVTNTELAVRPSKIVAGLEPGETNILLQTIGIAIEKKISTKEYVSKLSNVSKKSHTNKSSTKIDTDVKKSTSKDSNVKTNNKAKESTAKKSTKSSDTSMKSTNKLNKEPMKQLKQKDEKAQDAVLESGVARSGNGKTIKRKTELEEDGNSKQKTADTPLTAANEKSSISDSQRAEKVTDNQDDTTNENTDEKELPNTKPTSSSLIRPKSARPKSGGEHLKQNDSEQEPINELQILGNNNINKRPPSSNKVLLRPPSVRPSSARPGAPRLRQETNIVLNEPMQMGNINVIVENFHGNNNNNEDDDDETVVIQNIPEPNDDDGIISSDIITTSGNNNGNKGQLVEEILEQIQEAQQDIDGVKKGIEIDWEQDALRGKDAIAKEVTQLRNQIQLLTKSANPLGKLMSYLNEDIDAMHSEYQMWNSTKKQLYLDIEKQKKANIETTKPLLIKLEQLQEEKRKYEQEIITIRSNILRNDLKIKELLLTKNN